MKTKFSYIFFVVFLRRRMSTNIVLKHSGCGGGEKFYSGWRGRDGKSHVISVMRLRTRVRGACTARGIIGSYVTRELRLPELVHDFVQDEFGRTHVKDFFGRCLF